MIAAAIGATGCRITWQARSIFPAWGSGWTRVNHRGETVTLAEGPALVVGLTAGLTVSRLPGWVRIAALAAVTGAGILGLVDDLSETSTEKGLRGHLAAAREGRLTTGVLKVAGIGASSLAASVVIARDRPLRDQAMGGVVVAAAANLMNLLDLRPGRALKASLLGSAAVAISGRDSAAIAVTIAGVAASMLTVDLKEAAMMGDAGANALGACVGVAYLASRPSSARLGATLALLVALTLLSEKVSFTHVIESTPLVAEFDAWGRRR